MKSIKQFCLLWVSLFTLVAGGDTEAWGQFRTQKIKRTVNGQVQRGRVRRDLVAYPRTASGNTAFLSAMNSVTPPVAITLANGSIIAAAVAPPVVVTPPVVPPATSTALTILAPLYNCATGAITFRTSGGNGSTITYRATGITGPTTNPNQFLDSDARTAGDTPPFTIFVEQSGQTLSFSWSRQATCNGASTPTPAPTPPPSTTSVASIAYNKVLYVGNSITIHGGSQFFVTSPANPKRGMAATSPEKDYVHLLSARHRVANAGVQNKTFDTFNLGGTLDMATGPFLESRLTATTASDFYGHITDRFNAVDTYAPDLIYIRLGENVNDGAIPTIGQTETQTRLKALIDRVRVGNPQAKVVLSTSVWNKPNYDIAIRAVATERNYPIANFSNMWPNRLINGFYAINPSIYGDQATDEHPDDDGMEHIADGLWAVTPGVGVGTVTQPVAPAGGYDYPTVTTVATWPATNSRLMRGHRVSNVPIGEVARLENRFVRVEIRKYYGGATQVYDLATGRALFNFNDHGRQSEVMPYSGPSNYATSRGGPWSGIGWNPSLPGNYQDVPSQVIAFGYVTGNDGILRIYTKTQTVGWPSGAPGSSTNPPEVMPCTIEKWTGLIGKEVDTKTRTIFSRPDKTFYEAITNEYPNFMIAGNQTNTKYYNGNAPYTNASVMSTSLKENNTTAFTQTTHLISEPWVAVEYDQAGHYVFTNNERMGQIATAAYVISQVDPSENADPCTYTSSGVPLHVDADGTWYHNYGFFVTSDFNEGRAWANARPRRHGDVPNWTFNQAKGRNDWIVNKGYDQKEPFSNDNWKPVMVPSADGGPTTARRSSLESPFVIHKASQIPTIYVRMKYAGPATGMQIGFVRNGQQNRGLDATRPNENAARWPNGEQHNGQRLNFTVINDGQWHTYAIQTNQTAQWKDVIQRYQIYYGSGADISQNDSWEVAYFGVNNPGN